MSFDAISGLKIRWQDLDSSLEVHLAIHVLVSLPWHRSRSVGALYWHGQIQVERAIHRCSSSESSERPVVELGWASLEPEHLLGSVARCSWLAPRFVSEPRTENQSRPMHRCQPSPD